MVAARTLGRKEDEGRTEGWKDGRTERGASAGTVIPTLSAAKGRDMLIHGSSSARQDPSLRSG
jgi:hypothetical protein